MSGKSRKDIVRKGPQWTVVEREDYFAFTEEAVSVELRAKSWPAHRVHFDDTRYSDRDRVCAAWRWLCANTIKGV
jgi:hypothetical protein